MSDLSPIRVFPPNIPWYTRLLDKFGMWFFLFRYSHGLLTKAEKEYLLEQARSDGEREWEA